MKRFLTALHTGLVLFAMAVTGTGYAADTHVKRAS